MLSAPRLSMVAMGLFPKIPEPEFEVFVRHRQSWVKPAAREEDQCEFAEELGSMLGSICSRNDELENVAKRGPGMSRLD